MPERQDIISGIKQAIEHGSSIEQAKKSFLNAGYPLQDVEDSARVFSGVITQYPQQYTPQSVPQPSSQPVFSQKPIMPPTTNIVMSPNPNIQKKSKSMLFIILLAVVLVLLLGTLVGMLFFKEQLSSLFGISV